MLEISLKGNSICTIFKAEHHLPLLKTKYNQPVKLPPSHHLPGISYAVHYNPVSWPARDDTVLLLPPDIGTVYPPSTKASYTACLRCTQVQDEVCEYDLIICEQNYINYIL